MTSKPKIKGKYSLRKTPVPFKIWGEGIEDCALSQMKNACSLGVSVRGALMPDAHQGYGLPIGGVLAVRDAVIPYAVGMDIACRMKLSVLDFPISALHDRKAELIKSLETQTLFGVGAKFKTFKQHDVMDRDWSISPVTKKLKDQAWAQLGTSGSGNHFVEFGTLTLLTDSLGLKKGVYLSLLSHSGSRGTGAEIAGYYSRLAATMHPELPSVLKQLSWLDICSGEGQEYWRAMELMGHYAAANHDLIHRSITSYLRAEIIAGVENHHNFAWKEIHFGENVIVHRKGAVSAQEGTLSVIPGSMATPGFVVNGRGNKESLCSAAHGAGRRMSRKAAKSEYSWSDAEQLFRENSVKVLSAGLDEVPMAYKDIHQVMAAQTELVEIQARFDPKIVKMAPSGEPPED